MRRIVENREEREFDSLLGEHVCILSLNYFYYGKLVAANESFVVLEGGRIVYETGDWSAKSWTRAEKLPSEEWFVRTSTIESYGKAVKLLVESDREPIR